MYCVLVIIAAWRYREASRYIFPAGELPGISVLTPLAGADLGLEDNLRSSFRQNYPRFEVIFAVRSADDPAAPIAEKLMHEFPSVPARLIVAGEPECANAKVHSLKRMTEAASYDILVMNDSDIRGPRSMLRTIAAEFSDPALGLATCPYVAISGRGFAARLEALMMNSQFTGGVLVARLLEGVKFSLGPSSVVRRSALERIGGWTRLQSYLAEDFMLGKLIAESGAGTIMSSVRVEHHIGNAGFGPTMSHRLRWCRSTRRSRPWGYVGELFLHPLPIAAALAAASPALWPAAVAITAFRLAAAWSVGALALQDRRAFDLFWAIPVQDFIAFAVWTAGFFGNTVSWRGRTYQIHPDGTFEPVAVRR